MAGFNKESAKRIADVTRRIERTPINDGAEGLPHRPPSVATIAKLFRVSNQDKTNPQSVVEMWIYEVKITRNGQDVPKLSDMEYGDDVELTRGETQLCLNPRENILDSNALYFGFKVGKYWIIDNQAVFQSWADPV